MSGPPRLYDRDADLACVDALIAAVSQSQGRLMVVEGPPGIGKTALLEAAADRAAHRGIRVLRARAAAVESGFAFGVARQLFERELRGVAEEALEALFAGAAQGARLALDPVVASDGGVDALHGLYWLAANLAEHAPLLLTVDDAQWADVASWGWLRYLAPRLIDVPVALVLTWRSGEADSDAPVRELLTSSPALRIEPSPLTMPAMRALIESSLGPPSDAFAAACAKATGGNPFLLVETLSALATQKVVPGDAAAPRVAALGADAVADAVLARLERLGQDELRLAHAVAVLDADAELRLAADLAELSITAANAAADRLASARLLADARPLRFAHPLLRTAVVEALGRGERDALHRRAANLLCADPLRADRGVQHLLAAEPAADPWVVDQLVAAAGQALARGAPDEAARLLDRATVEPPGECAADVWLAAAHARSEAGRADAPAALDTAGQLAGRQHAARLCLERGRLHANHARMNAALACFEEGIDAASNPDERVLLEAEATAVGVTLDGTSARYGVLLEQRAARSRVDDPVARMSLASLAFQRAMVRAGTARENAGLARRALGDDLLSAGPARGTWAPRWAGWALLWSDAEVESGGLVDALTDDLRATGAAHAFVGAEAMDGLRALWAGRVTDVLGHVGAADTAFEVERLPLQQPFWRGLSVQGQLLAGDAEAAQAALDRYDGGGMPIPIVTSIWQLAARAELRLAQGRHDDARADAREVQRRAAVRGGSMGFGDVAALVLYAVGEQAEAAACAAAELDAARRWGVARQVSAALRAHALTGLSGREQVQALQDAVDVADAAGAGLALMLALTDLGAALRRSGERAAARDPLRRAVELATRSGAHGVSARGREELRATGARPRRISLSGVASLTPSELRTARLAAHGLNNREIAQRLWVSRSTIETQLSAAYRKLDITARSELAALLDSHDVSTDEPTGR